VATGIIKWFNDAKGFGFITPDSGGEDIFVHSSQIAFTASKTLKEGERVEFELGKTSKGSTEAHNVRTA